MRTLNDILQDEKVIGAHQEFDGWGIDEKEQNRASWWVELSPLFNHEGRSCIHAKTIKEVIEKLKEVGEGSPY
jgi:hypothetical protein